MGKIHPARPRNAKIHFQMEYAVQLSQTKLNPKPPLSEPFSSEMSTASGGIRPLAKMRLKVSAAAGSYSA